MWDKLKTMFAEKSEVERLRLRKELMQLRLNNLSSMPEFLDAIMNKLSYLLNIDSKIYDEEIKFVILEALPPRFNYAGSYIRNQDFGLDKTIAYLKAETKRNKAEVKQVHETRK